MRVFVPLPMLLLSACLPGATGPAPGPAPDLATPPAPAAMTVAPETADVPAGEDLLPVAILAEPSGEMLGRVVVSPGNPGEPGLWLRTSRTARTAQGTVVAANGASVDVVLIPADGVSELSAEGYAALGLAPGSFAEVTIYMK